MKITLTPITQEGKRAFSQLINLYNFNYDFTNYLNDDIPENGFFYGDADYYLSATCYCNLRKHKQGGNSYDSKGTMRSIA